MMDDIRKDSAFIKFIDDNDIWYSYNDKCYFIDKAEYCFYNFNSMKEVEQFLEDERRSKNKCIIK